MGKKVKEIKEEKIPSKIEKNIEALKAIIKVLESKK